MSRYPILFIVLALALVVAVPAFAQDDGPTPETTDAFWQGSYWNNKTLSGEPALRRTDSIIEFDWGAGSPDGAIGRDNFSARWTRYIEVPEPGGTYRFRATSDDGIRLWVDDVLVIDEWNDHPARTFTVDRYLAPGHHLLKVEYYENGGDAVARLEYYPTGHATDVWRGEYFSNRWLSGQPALIREDAAIGFDWGLGAPATGLPRDEFSARWTRTFVVDQGNAGPYRFTATSDDGIRVWVDGTLLISEWSDHPAQTFTRDMTLNAGTHEVKVEYYENAGYAVAKVNWAATNQGDGWQAQYYSNASLAGDPALSRTDAAIDFNWGHGAPAAGFPSDHFSVRWTRQMHVAPGTYRFTTTSDDGVRLFVNGKRLIDHWEDQAATSYAVDIYLDGSVRITMEYYERTLVAVAQLKMERVGGEPPPGPAVIVDNGDAGFVMGGAAGAWRYEAEGYNGDMHWTRNNDYERDNYNWARWYPNLLPGRYEVFVYVPDRFTTTESARYWVAHRDGYTLRSVNQAANGDRWVSLGSFNFRGNGGDYVSLSDVTFEPYLTTLIGFDAVKWERR